MATAQIGVKNESTTKVIAFFYKGIQYQLNPEQSILFPANDFVELDEIVDAIPDLCFSSVGTGSLSTTDELPEGATNLYYTETRVSANLDVAANTAFRHTHANKSVLDLITGAGSGEIISGAERVKLSNIETGATADQLASEVPVFPAVNGQTDVQSALEDIDGRIGIEQNTASDANLSGVGLTLPKSGVDLPFKGIDAGSTKITVTDDVPNNTVDIDVDESQISHQNLSGAGTNTHAQIDTHIGDATIHRSINDAGAGSTDLWSGSKITTELSGKADTSHTHVAADVTDFDTEVANNTDVAANTTHRGVVTGNPHAVTKGEVGLGNVENTLSNFNATTNPLVTDDSNAGYSVGSRWINTTTDEEFVCVDASVGAAIWINTTFDSSEVTLDLAYDNGATITADSGPVNIEGYTTQAPLRIAPSGTAPSASLAAGQEFTYNPGSVPFIKSVYDTNRSKWLSTYIMPFAFSTDGNAQNAYLRYGNMLSATRGARMLLNGTIIGVTATTGPGGIAAKDFQVRRNGVTTSLYSFTTASNVYSAQNVNVDFDANDELQVFVTGNPAGQVEDPVVILWIAWRA